MVLRAKTPAKSEKGQRLSEGVSGFFDDVKSATGSGGGGGGASSSRPDSGIGSAQVSPAASPRTCTPPSRKNAADQNSQARMSALERDALRARPERSLYLLEYSWTFWVTDLAEKDWNKAIKQVGSFSTVPDFWRLFNYLLPPSQVDRYSYNLFKKNIRPEWEDPANENGGRWNICSALNDHQADEVWNELCMLIVGGAELGELASIVNGLYLTRKRHVIRVSLWLSSTEQNEVYRVGELIQRTLCMHIKRRYGLEFTECKPSTSSRGKKMSLLLLN